MRALFSRPAMLSNVRRQARVESRPRQYSQVVAGNQAVVARRIQDPRFVDHILAIRLHDLEAEL